MKILLVILTVYLSYNLMASDCIRNYNKFGCEETTLNVGSGMAIEQYKVIYDEDQDDVVDSLDKCPGTPYNTEVDENGCAIIITPIEKKAPDKTLEAVEETVDTTTTTLAVQFDTAKYVIKDQYKNEVKDFATFMLEHPQQQVKIVGHTDSVNLYNRNMELSFNRANAVRDMLISLGVEANRITTDGVGPNEPIASNATAEGRAQNRRIEVTFTTKGDN